MNVLIVDDDATECAALADAFREAGYDVVCAADGAEGILRLNERRADVIVLDLRMPVLDGYTFLERLRHDATLAAIPVIVCTAAEYDGRLAAAAAYVKKPCRARDLVERARRLVPP